MSRVEEITTDVAIVGSGVAGALIASELAKKDIKVVVLEAGPRLARGQIFTNFLSSPSRDFGAPYPITALAPRPSGENPDDGYILQQGKDRYWPFYLRLVGGTTWHWGAATLRFSPDDFSLMSHYGVGKDWPISYRNLEPYYDRAEVELGVSGDAKDSHWAPRSGEFPMPPVTQSYMDQVIKQKTQQAGFKWVPRPHARNSEIYDNRPECYGHNNCSPICPIGAQYSADVHIRKAEAAGAQVIEEALVTKIHSNAEGMIEGLNYVRSDGSSMVVRAKAYVVAANTIESPRLLLLSANEYAPQGIANSSDMLGRNLMNHPSTMTVIHTQEPVYGGRGPKFGMMTTEDINGPMRKSRSGFYLVTESWDRLPEVCLKLIDSGLRGEALDHKIRHIVSRQFQIISHCEELPSMDNRLTLDHHAYDSAGLPKVKINYQQDDYSKHGQVAVKRKIDQLVTLLDGKIQEHRPLEHASHMMGTACMGHDPKTSVVDKECRTHDHKNLFLAGSAVFPTGGVANPTLTIAALSLRIAETIGRQLS